MAMSGTVAPLSTESKTTNASQAAPMAAPRPADKGVPADAPKPGRDTYIDFVRGLLMLSVIHIHTVWWSLAQFTPDIVRHLAYLVDVPIFFFISGYLLKNTTFRVSVRSAWKQFTRLYLQYVIISLLVAVGLLIWIRLGGDRLPRGMWRSLLSIFRVELTGELWGHLKNYDGNLWYLRAYFPLLLLVPFLVGTTFFRHAKGPLLAFVFICYALFTYHYRRHVILLAPAGRVFFYATYFVVGALYRSGEKTVQQKTVALSFVLNLVLAGLVFHFDGNTLQTGPYKFPPSVQYLIYTTLLIHVFLLVKPYWSRLSVPALAPVVWAGRNSLELYLIQGAVCSRPFYFVRQLGTENPWALYAWVYSFNVLVSFALVWLYVAVRDGVRRAAGTARRRVAEA
jgi:peptidoglycan/LPS O-acetylase OafA/YrhL